MPFKSPQNFRVTAKFPKITTHAKRLKGVDKELKPFFEAIGPLADKTLALLNSSLLLCRFSKASTDLETLPELDNSRYAVEVRNRSRFQDLVYNFFGNNDICMVKR
jgi:uncharacterized protein YecE (DUF72 family)